MRRRFPQDGRAALRRDDRIRRVLQHQRRIADRNRKRAARTSFADHGDDDGCLEPGHFI